MRKTGLLRLAAGAIVVLSLGGCFYPYGGPHPGYGGPGGPPPPPPHDYWR